MAFENTVMAKNLFNLASQTLAALRRRNTLIEEQNKVLAEMSEELKEQNNQLALISERMRWIK